jgi:NAD(P)-dependent dehydrogenase (short-subunit alcohol dehydrogenase family)
VSELQGRGAVVTGGGRGIGAAIARALAQQGANVIVAARSAGEIEAVSSTIRAAGGKAWPIPVDVTLEASVESLAEEARVHVGAVDVLINCAGEGASAPFHKITLEAWNAMLAVHATGTFLCTRAFVPGMMKRGWGRVVNVASVAGYEGGKYIAHYSAAKHAVVGFTRSVALELEDTGVTINAVCPGYVDTPMTQRTLANIQARAGLDRKQALAAILASTGQERLIAPEEVATAVLAFCREDAGDANGHIIVVHAKEPAA